MKINANKTSIKQINLQKDQIKHNQEFRAYLFLKSPIIGSIPQKQNLLQTPTQKPI